ncbi:MAG: DUF2961 domain-containing protein [Dokdonella sp.]
MRALHRIGCAIACVAAGDLGATGLPWEIWESPATLAVIDAGDSVLERSSHCLDGCRYDRSNAGAESGNAFPERWLYRDGTEVVVFDERGPGAVTRLWLTTGFGTSTCIDPGVRVRFYVDGAVAPTLDVALAALFDGTTAPFTAPLVAARAQSSGGYVSYVPIAYAQSLRISLLNAENGGVNPCQPVGADPTRRLLWFQLQHHRIVPGTPVTSFSAGHDEPGWRAFLAHAGDDPWNAMLAPQNANWILAPGAMLTLATRSGAEWLRGIRLQLPRSAYAQVKLRLRFDGATTVDVPLADFFATAASATLPARGVLLGEDASGWLYAWLPMPFTQDAEVSLIADAGLPASIAVASALSFDNAVVPTNAGTLTTTLTDNCVAGGALPLYADGGAGKIVGVSARYDANGAGTRGYLEGDERAAIDGAIAPAWYGTGVEDFYNGGFYFDQGAYARPLSGATEVDVDGHGATAVYRLLPTDSLVYANGVRLHQEAGYAPALPSPTCARTVVHAYRRAQRLMVAYDAFEIGNGAAAAAHAYVGSNAAACATLNSQFEDEPPSVRNALACSYASGSSHFRFRVDDAELPLRLRRTFDAGNGTPGDTAGAAAAEIRINGVAAGWFPPAIANPARRWQQQDAMLDIAAGTTVFDVEIIPEFGAATPQFGESRWELFGGWKDGIFVDGFEP